MGLDSYLYKKTYVQNWEHTSPERRYSVVVKQGGLKCNIKPERISTLLSKLVIGESLMLCMVTS